MMLSRSDSIDLMNALGAARKPFYFIVDFKGSKAFISETTDTNQVVQFDFSNKPKKSFHPNFELSYDQLNVDQFETAFNRTVSEIKFGNSFLINLSFKHKVDINLSLLDIYQASQAKYKVFFPDRFVCFSPETFIQIMDKTVYSYPMKGTIDADTPNAREVILEDAKEMAEHVTIVDLIRNDLSQIAQDVTVTNFRFISEVQTNRKRLLQVSSEIRGKLTNNWQDELGSLIFKLLPAGSISGAPKPKTVEIIEAIETYERGFYTGICGYFDGENLDSGVMIRFIEQERNSRYYKSGAGITSFSDPKKEYQEILDKIYVPIH